MPPPRQASGYNILKQKKKRPIFMLLLVSFGPIKMSQQN